MNKATGTTLFISNDPLPENPSREDYDKLNWVSVGEINAINNVAIKTDKFITRGNIEPYILAGGKINKPKRQRFGRVITLR